MGCAVISVTHQASLAKVLFLANLRIRPGFSPESNAGVRQNLRKGEECAIISKYKTNVLIMQGKPEWKFYIPAT